MLKRHEELLSRTVTFTWGSSQRAGYLLSRLRPLHWSPPVLGTSHLHVLLYAVKGPKGEASAIEAEDAPVAGGGGGGVSVLIVGEGNEAVKKGVSQPVSASFWG